MRVFFAILMLFSSAVWGQTNTGSMTFKSSTEGLEMKWYTESLVNYAGVNIFRKTTDSEWQQINLELITPLTNIDVNENDEIELVNEIVRSKSSLVGIPLINSMVSSFKYVETAKILGIYFLDKDVNAGMYQYQVRTNTGSVIATSELLDVAQLSSPPPPSAFEIKQSKRKAKFKWESAPMDYFAVNVYAKVNGEVQKLNKYPLLNSELESDGERFNFEFKLEERTKYELYVKSIGFFYEESEASQIITIDVGDFTLPAQPKGFDYKQYGINKVELKWHKYEDSTAEFLYVLRGLDYDTLKPVASFNISEGVTSFTDSSTLPGDYYYAVAGVDEYDNWNVTERIIVHIEDLEPPKPPVNITATADSGKVFLKWDAVVANDLKGYVIFRAGGAKEEFKPLNAVPIATNSYQFSLSMRTKSNLNFYVLTVDSSLNRSVSSDTIEIRQPDYVPPVPPLIKNVMVSDTSLNIHWLANTEADLHSYEVYRKLISDTVFTLVATVARETNLYADQDFTASVIYQYYLIASDSAGNESTRSNIFTIQSPLKSLEDAKELPVKWKYKAKKEKLTLNWSTETAGRSIVFEKSGKSITQKTGLINESKITIFDVVDANEYWIKVYGEGGVVAESKKIILKSK